MSFISALERLIKYASKDHMQQNKLANYLHSHADDIAELVKAALPLAHYSKMRDAKPMNGMDDAINSIHVGTEWEAEITQSQLRALSDALANLNKEKS